MANRRIEANVAEKGIRQSLLGDQGSSTTYHGLQFEALSLVSPGDELFVSADDEWFKWADQPTVDELSKLDKDIEGLVQFHKANPEVIEAQWIDLLHRCKTEVLQELSRNVLPRYPSILQDLLRIRRGGATEANFIPRSIDWLEKNGMCIDHIREGTSLIEGAGRGAFARRSLPKGSIVMPAPPLINIFNLLLIF